VLAAQRAGQLRDPDRLLPWLFAIARHVCYRRLRERNREMPVDIESDALTADTDLERGLSAEEARALVWAAAEGLNERDRAVLYLNTSEGLEGADLAAALGVQHANPYSLLNRAKRQLERAITTLLVARFGRRDCAPLSEMLAEWDGSLTPLLRKRLMRHLATCAACRRTQSRVLPISAVAIAPALETKRADALDEIDADELFEIAARTPRTDEPWPADGFPPLEVEDARRHRRKLLWLVASAVGVFIATSLGVVAAGGDDTQPTGATPAPQPQPSVAPSSTARGTTTTSSVIGENPVTATTRPPARSTPTSQSERPRVTVPPPAVSPQSTTPQATTPTSTVPPPTVPTTPPPTSPPPTPPTFDT
jgi:RNA polymerase sigma factor (sigma-70 family)